MMAIGSIAALASCGRVSYGSTDASTEAPGLDAPGLDAPGLDAPALDAPALDAPAPDAPGLDAPALDTWAPDAVAALDAPGLDASGLDGGDDAWGDDAGLDASVPDAGGDAGNACRVRWSVRLAGTQPDVANGPWVDADGDVLWGGFGGAGGGAVLEGVPCDGHCFASFSRDGTTRYVVPTEGYVSAGPDRAIAAAVSLTHVSLREYDGATGAAGLLRGTVSLGTSVSAGIAFGTTSAMTFYGTAMGDVGLLGSITSLVGRGAYVGHWDLSSGTSVADWAVVFDGPGDELIPFAQLLPDGSVGVWARSGASVACVTGVARPDTTRPCAGVASSLLMVVSAEGVIESDFTTAAPLQARLVFLADHGAVVRTSTSLERWRADGSVVWNRPLTGMWSSVRMVHDEARGRVILATHFDTTTRYDGTAFEPLGAEDTVGIAVLELDDATGAQRRAFQFGVAGTANTAGVTFDALGRLYVAIDLDGTATLCPEGGPLTTSARDAWLLAID
jgi:hypothetical protein